MGARARGRERGRARAADPPFPRSRGVAPLAPLPLLPTTTTRTRHGLLGRHFPLHPLGGGHGGGRRLPVQAAHGRVSTKKMNGESCSGGACRSRRARGAGGRLVGSTPRVASPVDAPRPGGAWPGFRVAGGGRAWRRAMRERTGGRGKRARRFFFQPPPSLTPPPAISPSLPTQTSTQPQPGPVRHVRPVLLDDVR